MSCCRFRTSSAELASWPWLTGQVTRLRLACDEFLKVLYGQPQGWWTKRSGWVRSNRAIALSVSPLNPHMQTTPLSSGDRSRTCLHTARAGANP